MSVDWPLFLPLISSECGHFTSRFGKLLNDIGNLNPDFTIIQGDFNVRSKLLCSKDNNTNEGT